MSNVVTRLLSYAFLKLLFLTKKDSKFSFNVSTTDLSLTGNFLYFLTRKVLFKSTYIFAWYVSMVFSSGTNVFAWFKNARIGQYSNHYKKIQFHWRVIVRLWTYAITSFNRSLFWVSDRQCANSESAHDGLACFLNLEKLFFLAYLPSFSAHYRSARRIMHWSSFTSFLTRWLTTNVKEGLFGFLSNLEILSVRAMYYKIQFIVFNLNF